MGSFIFERDDKVGGIYTLANTKFTAAQYDFIDGFLYYIDTIDAQQVKRWDDPASPAGSFDWWSKEFWTPMYLNFGAARLLADFTGGVDPAAANAATQAANLLLTDAMGGFGDFAIDDYAIGDGVLGDMISGASASLTFQLYVYGQLVYQVSVLSEKIFRLPSGFKTDHHSVRVSGGVRLRQIQLGETPTELAKI
jgi:hypothetical protein